MYLENATELENLSPRRIASLLYERSTLKLPYPFLQFYEDAFRKGEYPEIPETVPVLAQAWVARDWPRTVAENINRCLCNLARKSWRPGYPVHLKDSDTPIFFTEEPLEQTFIQDAMCEYGWIKRIDHPSESRPSLEYKLLVTPEGWARYEELTAGKASPENPAFVAMWFGDKDRKTEMDDLYEEAIKPAINDAGYRARKSNSEEHNNYIMDQILGYIRMAPFVVAELTSHNSGVYYEAGFAAGLGTPVIPCCPTDESKNVHFDIQQVNQIRWSTKDNLKRQLTARILGSIGRGPHNLETLDNREAASPAHG
ncbi:MAG: hypothetical protein ABIG44_05105 [Planctomycetota bacterium]